MNYAYPKLSDKDLHLFRVGGAGLGNILFTYARAVVYAQKHPNTQVIWPTWLSLKLGPILRREKDKRFYHDLFRNHSGYINGVKKSAILLTKKRISEKEALENPDFDERVIEFEGFVEAFTPIMHDSKAVYDDLVKNLAKKNEKAVSFDGKKAICMHVRLGDFTRVTWEEVLQGKHCSSIPIEWYVNMAKDLRRIVGEDVKIYIFSDGTDEELQPLLALPNVERKTFGTAIGDILALAQSGIFVASGSSFSMWARYLGRMTTIMFPNQVKQEILQEYDNGKEIVALEKISDEYYKLIKNTLRNI
ncbi:MAG: alpha-1,2-fucosyltransferase [Clostridia bacterium]|nr:alpha-1,2-fucosyltransferase [Clostridia bacterium]